MPGRQPWTPDHDVALASYYKEGLPIVAIAKKLRRNTAFIGGKVGRLIHLKIVQRRPRRTPKHQLHVEGMAAIEKGVEEKFQQAMNGRRYEDAPHTQQPFAIVSRPLNPITYTGSSGDMCERAGGMGGPFFTRRNPPLDGDANNLSSRQATRAVRRVTRHAVAHQERLSRWT